MSGLRYACISLLQTLLRMLPFPCRTGLIRIGSPGPDSPVLLTGNFRLTVERVRRALRGLDAYLLVANSRGVNVWCAATGGLLTDHDVISVLKTSGIELLVEHRRVVLPQLAATGIDGHAVQKRTGWRTLWGPADVRDVPAFLAADCETTRAMRTTRFGGIERVEMAAAWAFPISLLSLLLLPFWSAGVPGMITLTWGLSLAIFLAFPLYESWLHGESERVGPALMKLAPHAAPALLWLLFLLGLGGYTVATGQGWTSFAVWAAGSFVVLAILGLDLMGSTPTYKSGLHEDRLLRITLDEERCKGAGFCEKVCPVDVFVMDHARRLATLPGAMHCVQCGACVVQCPFDALAFQTPDGERISPDTIRRFKLNLMGKRTS